jgi:hypothetical protein
MNKENSSKYLTCTVRKEERGYCVPVGNSYVQEDKLINVPYRWVDGNGIEDDDGENFQIFHDGKWQEAQSIDFDFPCFGQIAASYQSRFSEYQRKISDIFSGKRPANLCCPNYASEVILPVIKLLADALPEYGIIIIKNRI